MIVDPVWRLRLCGGRRRAMHGPGLRESGCRDGDMGPAPPSASPPCRRRPPSVCRFWGMGDGRRQG
uniref:Uncharacterized protein n=1 Tax=Oryza meridionalis TaxID=40149 RepID=A0A0E0D5C3_9ORYZ